MPTGKHTTHGRQRGFTMLELMVVITVILILLSLAAGQYRTSIRHAKEATLAHDLWVMRKAIDAYTLDKQAAPQSLQDLVTAGYIYELPVDPITGQRDWVPVFEEVILSPDQLGTGIANVHSASTSPSLRDGSPYNSW
ncbi:MAG TPA: type II secretion system protein [Candidatus Acidoferrales bacterium]